MTLTNSLFQSTGNTCQCDNYCTMYGNCCPDYNSFCSAGTTSTAAPKTATTTTTTVAPKTSSTAAPKTTSTPAPSPNSCAAYKACGAYKAGQPCQCDSSCTKFGNCCSDYTTTCSSQTAAPGTTSTAAPATASCAKKCGSYSSSNICQCDDLCATYGDCCNDKVALCGVAASA